MHLTDSEIMEWNDRIPKDSKIFIAARYSNMASQPTIAFCLKDSHLYPPSIDGKNRECGDPGMKYRFAFSIAANRESEFFEIFEKLARDPFENHVQDGNGTTSRLKLDRKVAEEPIRTKHRIFEKEYLRLEYSFEGRISSIMAYVRLLEDSIEYFSMIWGYDEDGNEYNLLKYPIGSMVSPVDDKSKDMLVLDFRLVKSGSLYIDYVACEILSVKNSAVVKYGPVQTFSEKYLTWSRNGRIDGLLDE